MTRFVRPSIGVIGRIVAVLLIALLVEVAASSFLYERASRFSGQEDDARRLAEHVAVSRRLLAETPPSGRAKLAASLSTDHYEVRWDTVKPTRPPVAPSLDEMRQQVLASEPPLAQANLRLHLTSPGRGQRVSGGVTLPDGSWLHFRTRRTVEGLNLFGERAILALIPAVALMILAGTLVRRQLQPLRRLAQSADRVGQGGGAHVPVEGPGEVRRVVAAFNRMQDRIHRLIEDRTQALAAVGHDFRTPLARLRLRADQVENACVRRAMETDIVEMEAMVASLLAYLGGGEEPERQVSTDVAVLAMTMVDEAEDAGANARYVGPDHLDATVRRVALKRALSNLMSNALRYGETVTLSVENQGDRIAFAVEDDGPGIPEEQLLRALEPFVRLEAARGRDAAGFGLGLAIVQRMAEAEGGSVTLSNRVQGGLKAQLVLPRH